MDAWDWFYVTGFSLLDIYLDEEGPSVKNSAAEFFIRIITLRQKQALRQ